MMATQEAPREAHHEGSLAELQQELKDTDKDIAETNSDLKNSQNALKQLASHKTDLERAVSKLASSQAEIAKLRAAAEVEFEDGYKVYNELLTKLKMELSDEQRAGIQKDVKGVDDEISELSARVGTARAKVQGTDDALTQAKDKVATLEGELNTTQAALSPQLSTQIKADQAQVAKLKTDAKAAFDGGRDTEAFFLTGELQLALEHLEDSLSPKKETDLAGLLASQLKDLMAAKDRFSNATAELELCKKQLATLEGELQARTRGRQAAIKTKLAAAHAGTAPPGTPPLAQRPSARATVENR